MLAVAFGCAGSPTPPEQAPHPPAPPAPPPAAPRPPDAALELSLARSARTQGRVEDEAEHLERAIEGDPGAVEARLDLAGVLLRRGADLARAATLLDDAERLGGPGARLLRLRGWLCELRGDDAGAVEAYARSLAERPDPDLGLRQGQLLQRLGRKEDAARELAGVIQQRPSDRAARAVLADVYEGQGRFHEAEGMLLEIAALAPLEAAPERRLAAFYLRHGEPAKARAAEARARALEGAPRALRPLRPSKR